MAFFVFVENGIELLPAKLEGFGDKCHSYFGLGKNSYVKCQKYFIFVGDVFHFHLESCTWELKTYMLILYKAKSSAREICSESYNDIILDHSNHNILFDLFSPFCYMISLFLS